MRTHILQQIIQDKPETATLIKNKYRVIAGVLQRMYPELTMPQAKLAEIAFDAIALDREWRLETEGMQKDEKKRLSDKKKVELGYLPNEEWFNNLK
jgi:hypothetical protein